MLTKLSHPKGQDSWICTGQKAFCSLEKGPTELKLAWSTFPSSQKNVSIPNITADFSFKFTRTSLTESIGQDFTYSAIILQSFYQQFQYLQPSHFLSSGKPSVCCLSIALLDDQQCSKDEGHKHQGLWRMSNSTLERVGNRFTQLEKLATVSFFKRVFFIDACQLYALFSSASILILCITTLVHRHRQGTSTVVSSNT